MKLLSWRGWLMAAALLLSLTGHGWAQGDTQVWHDTTLERPVSKVSSLFFHVGFRLDNDATHLNQWLVNPGISFKAHRYLTITPSYQFQVATPFSGRRAAEHRLNLDVTPNYAWQKYRLSDRNRVERRFINGQPSLRYRNQLRLERALTNQRLINKWFIADEFFYDSRFHSINRNRITLGISKDLGEQATLEVYYLYQSTDQRPQRVNAIGTTLRLRL